MLLQALSRAGILNILGKQNFSNITNDLACFEPQYESFFRIEMKSMMS